MTIHAPGPSPRVSRGEGAGAGCNSPAGSAGARQKKPRKKQRERRRDGRTTREAVTYVEELTRMQRRIDRDRMNEYARLVAVALRDQSPAQLGLRCLRAELAAALHVSEHAVERELDLAHTLATRYIATSEVLGAGLVGLAHVRVICDAGLIIGSGEGAAIQHARYEAAVLEYAIEETPARLKPIAKRLAEEYAEVSLDERHAAARKRRRIEVVDREDGMAELYAYLPAEIAYAIKDRVQRIAKHTWTAENATVETARRAAAREDAPRDTTTREPEQAGQAGQAGQGAGSLPSLADQVAPARSLDEVRADTLAELLLNGNPYTDLDVSEGSKAAQVPSGFFAHVQVMVPVDSIPAPADPVTTTDTATTGAATASGGGTGAGAGAGAGAAGDGVSAAPRPVCELVGYGPISSQIAHDLLALSRNISRVDEDEHGNVLRVDRYKPTKAMRTLLWARDRRCRFPGCTRLPQTCDMDHTTPWEHGGPTATTNLELLCRGHHSLRHGTNWRPVQDRTGTVTWQSPTGRVHVDRLAGRRYPRPDPGPDPGADCGPSADCDPSADCGPDPWDEAPAIEQEFNEFLWWRKASTEADRPKPANTTAAQTAAPTAGVTQSASKRPVRFESVEGDESSDVDNSGTGGNEAPDCGTWHTGFTVRDRLTALEKHAIACGCNYPEFCDPECRPEIHENFEHRATRRASHRPVKEQPF